MESYSNTNENYAIDTKKDYSNFDRVKRTKVLSEENRIRDEDNQHIK